MSGDTTTSENFRAACQVSVLWLGFEKGNDIQKLLLQSTYLLRSMSWEGEVRLWSTGGIYYIYRRNPMP